MNKKIIISLSVIGLVAAIAIGGTIAYFNDTETSSGNTFTAGTLNLKVGADDPTTWGFSIGDIKPGDSGFQEVTLYDTGSIDGFLHITFANLVNDDVSCTEPEREAESGDCGTDGELAENLDIKIFLDVNENNNLELGIDTLIYRGKAKGILQGDLFNYYLPGGASRDFRIEWVLDNSIGNIVQTDKTGFDIVFELTQNPKEIVGDWHFDEGDGFIVYDSSGYGNNGTISEGGMWAQYGKYNPALYFDGNDKVDCGLDASLNPQKVTLEAWVKRNGTPGTYKYIADKHYKSGWASYALYTGSSGGLRFYIGHSDGYVLSPDAGTGIWDGEWHHLVGTYDGSKVRLYVDGTEVGTGTATTVNIDYRDRHFYIGSYGDGFYFNGMIDEVRIYPRALNASEILEQYNKGL